MTLGGLTNQSTGTLGVFGSGANQAKLNIVAGPADNAGDLAVHEHVAFTTTAGVDLTNTGPFNVDTGVGAGASTVTVAGTLGNSNSLNIGNTKLSAPTTVTAAALTNSGTVGLLGSTTPGMR